MTLAEIFDILDKNIKANGGTLKLSADTISSPEITDIFTSYLLNEELIVDSAKATQNAKSVTVTGDGNSFIFFKTQFNTLIFTVDSKGVPSMAADAVAIIKEEDGWTFGASFPALKMTNWGGFFDPGDKTNWIQYLFFKTAAFKLSAAGLHFTGDIELTQTLGPLIVLFGLEKITVTGAVTINTGDNGFVADSDTAVPVMNLEGLIAGDVLQLGTFPPLSLSFSMDSLYYTVDFGEDLGKPGAELEILIKSTMPIDDEEIGLAIVVGAQANALTFRAILPAEKEIGITELISLANNENVLAIMPSNIPVVYDFFLKDFEITFNTERKALSVVTIEVATRTTPPDRAFSWTIIPGFITLKSINLGVVMSYLAGKFEPALTIEGIIAFGPESAPVNVILSASFPSYVFVGSLDPETPVDLRGILIYFLGEGIGSSLPNTLQLGVLTISIDTKNSTYSLETSLTTDLQIPVILTTIVVRTVAFNINYVAGVATGSITGEFQVGTGADAPFLFVTAAYNGPEAGWVFSGGLKDGSAIKLKQLIDTYLPEEYHAFNPFDITITTLYAAFNQGGTEANNSYNFKLGADWKLDLGLGEPIIIAGLTEIAYNPKATDAKYTGFIEGSLNLGNIRIGARVDFKAKYNAYTFFFNGFEATLDTNAEGDQVICFGFKDDSTLGGFIELLVNAATGQDITLPAPWSVMNNIKLSNFIFSFNLTKNRIGLSYPAKINLGFVNIQDVSLYYTYYPNEPNKAPLVEIGFTGTFLGGALPTPQPWNVLEPDKAPAVPGQGESLFKLEFLGMGQHVSLMDGASPKSVTEAIDLLIASFDSDSKTPTNPIAGTKLRFNSSSNWLIGSKFVIVDTFAIGVVFFDPDMYGLSLYVNGPKAKVFQGLKFEILYKKISDSVGVYQIYLKLPDAIRQIDFGTVSVTLPSIRIYIYTNGDFKIDFGFPVNDDFSESFGLQLLPFVGSGGFYFGVLSSETADTTPKNISNGNFSPVIVFGVGLRVGVGKEMNKGILKAGISIVVQGILEGTYAQFNYYKSEVTNFPDPSYYYILGKLSIIGHVYGAVNFAIISAEVDLKVFVSARIVFQSYEPILITLSAGVSVSLKVRINLGIFSFSISLSFSTTVQFSFTIGSKQITPWKTNTLYATHFRRLAFATADNESECPVIPQMKWLPIIPTAKVELEIIYIPQFTAATDEGETDQKARAVAMLYLESSIDQPTTKQRLLRNGVAEEVDFPFTKFAKGAFLWVLGAYFNQTEEGILVDTILDKPISIPQLNEIICYFSQKDLVTPFTLEQVFAFMANYLDATVVIPARTTQVVAEKSVSVLPMLPNLVFETPAGDIYFSNEQAEYTYDDKQLALIQVYFKELAVRNKGTKEAQPSLVVTDQAKQSLATFMLIDYISLLGKESTQKGIDRLTSLLVDVEEGDSVEDIVNKHPNLGISAVELAYSNRKRNLNSGVALAVGNVRYTVKHDDTLQSIGSKFNVEHQHILKANTYVKQAAAYSDCKPKTPLLETTERVWGFDDSNRLIPGAVLQIPGVRHFTADGEPESLLSVANKYGVNVLDLVIENTSAPGLFPGNSKLLVPFAESVTVRELIAAMDANNDFEQLSGLSANIMLQGLRVPLPKENSEIGEPEAMYKISGQEIDASELVAEQSLTLKLNKQLDWLNLGTKGGVELAFTLLPEDIIVLTQIQDASLEPVILQMEASALFDVQARKFSLPSNITWQLPAAISLANGSNLLQDTIDPSIWMFNNSLEALLNGYDAIAPKVRLLKQVQETQTKTACPEPIANYSWSTKIDVSLRQVKSAEDPTKLMPDVYELQGIDQASMTLLQNLIEYYATNAGTSIISQIDILYPKEPAKEGQTEPPSGLRSDSLANNSLYLLQTNLSTLSNPPQSTSAVALTALPGTQENLLGMSQIAFLKYVWEAAIVNSGGYFLYYHIKTPESGLPDYLFNGDNDNTISLVITYNITDGILLNFLNSVVIRDPINIEDEILYVETVPQVVTAVAMPEGDTLKAMAKRYSTSISAIAVQNKKALFNTGARLSIPKTAANANSGAHVAASADSMELVAAKYGVSVIALAHANKNTPQLFGEPLTFDTRIEVKVATVPPGNIGFTVKRQNPETITGLDNADNDLQELYNLLGYNIAPNTEFNASVSGLPVAPGDNNAPAPCDADPEFVARPSAADNVDYLYNRIVPVYPFVKAPVTPPVDGDVPPEKENPYRAVGKSVQIDMRWQDIFGNLTSFTNTSGPGIPISLPPVTIGYTDPVIGLSLYPSVSASYIVENSSEDVPNLYITLAFNATNYIPVYTPPDDAIAAEQQPWEKRALADREAYKQIYYQLVQPDVKITISNTLEKGVSITAIEESSKELLLNMVVAIYQYLGEILAKGENAYVFYTVKENDTLETIATAYNTTPQNIRRANPSIPADGKLTVDEVIVVPIVEIPADEVISTPVSDTNPLNLFALVTKLTLAREIDLVDDNFKDEPSVIASTSVLGPNLKSGAADNSNSISIQEFARKLQKAFPELKAASGMPQLGVEDDSAIDIWVARFDDSATGIQFSIPNAGKPYYFALLPLSTHLLSRDKVKIYPYHTGKPIYDEKPVEGNFNGVDIEKLAETCLAAIDVFLQADFAIPAWQVENTITPSGEILRPYQSIINAKKALADNIVKHMATILVDKDNIPGDNNVTNAKERLKQELLISLSNAYTIDTVLQFNVDVTSPYTDPDVIAPQLFGKVIDPNDTTQSDQKAYAFSTTRFSVENSVVASDDLSYLTILFNTKKENNLHLTSGYFPIGLRYEINSIEHDIKEVEGIEGYKSSSWLTFILPFEDTNTALGNLKIPIPLRVYPTSPSLTAQSFLAFGQTDQFRLLEKTDSDKLQEAKKWDYSYTYDYLRAQQDTINTDIIINVPAQAPMYSLFADEEEPDLFAALLQFSSAYQGIQKDFNQYLLDQSNPEFAYTAMQSFAWLVKRVAKAWATWQEQDKQLYRDVAGVQANYKFEIVEGEVEIEIKDNKVEPKLQLALSITVTPQKDTTYRLPDVKIEGFELDARTDTPELKSFAYYVTLENGDRRYLSPDDGQKISQRKVGYKQFNIINEENVWSGISVIRNKILVPGIETNTAFIYTTPTIRFVNVLTPLLEPDIEINMADYVTGEGKQPLQLYLSNFFKALFSELINETTSRQIKIGTSYSYNVQEGIDGLNTDIPVSISLPFDFKIPGDWFTTCPVPPNEISPQSPFVCQLTALINNWFASNMPATTNAMFKFDISLFTGLSNTQLPVLRLSKVYLAESNIKWS